MRTAGDNCLFLRGPASHDVDERADTRTQVEKPEDEPILTRPLHAFDRERNFRIIARKFPTGRCDFVADLERWQQDRVHQPATDQYAYQSQDWPMPPQRKNRSTAPPFCFNSGSFCDLAERMKFRGYVPLQKQVSSNRRRLVQGRNRCILRWQLWG